MGRIRELFWGAQPLELFDTIVAPRKWGHSLLPSSGWSFFNFVWNTWFGWSMVLSGLLNAVAVAHVLGARPSYRSHSWALLFCCLASCVNLFSFAMFILWLAAPDVYYSFDKGADELLNGELSPIGTIVLPAGTPAVGLLNTVSWSSWIMLLVYMMFWPATLYLELRFGHACVLARQACLHDPHFASHVRHDQKRPMRRKANRAGVQPLRPANMLGLGVSSQRLDVATSPKKVGPRAGTPVDGAPAADPGRSKPSANVTWKNSGSSGFGSSGDASSCQQ